MQEQAGTGLSPQSPPKNQALIEQKLKLQAQVKTAGGWFFWIAGLSLVNSIVMLAGKTWHFFIGLGITSWVDTRLGGIARPAALVINLSFIGVLVLFGIFARKQQKWAFILGMVLYGRIPNCPIP